MKWMIGLAVGAALFAVPAANAQDWPTKPVTVICPWSAGGGTDATARMLAQGLEAELGQPVNVVNQTGGGGLVGHLAIANAKPDGYTIGTVTVEIAMYRHQGLSDIDYSNFSQIALYNAEAVAIHVRSDSSLKSVKDLFDLARSEPGKMRASGAGRGGIAHLAFAGLVQAATGDANTIPWVPSEGSAPALQQLTAGAIEVVATTMAEAQTLVDAGEVRTLAVIATDRLSEFPDTPTTKEILGIDFAPQAFRGVSGPAGIPEDIVDKLSKAVERVTESEQFSGFMRARGFNITYLDPAAYQDLVVSTDKAMGTALVSAGVIK
jgi:tripartite-type tricarboxylate transporter receptor subunit TctC